MAIYELFSKRQRRLRGEVPDVYVYDDLPRELRVQIIHILRDTFGPSERDQFEIPNTSLNAFNEIHDMLAREYGVFSLGKQRNEDGWDAVTGFILSSDDHEKIIDAVELCLKFIDLVVRENAYRYEGASQSPDEAIDELNQRFQEHGIGFQYEAGQVVRIDSRLMHAEVVKPALSFLSDKSLKGPNEEFLKAHEHYRAGRHKECVAECLKAFESTMKAICDRRKWSYGANDTAKPLIDVLFKHELIPNYLQSEFSALRTILESGVPTLRNRTSGHGQGSTPVELPSYLASYVLHLTASTILFLCEADKNLK